MLQLLWFEDRNSCSRKAGARFLFFVRRRNRAIHSANSNALFLFSFLSSTPTRPENDNRPAAFGRLPSPAVPGLQERTSHAGERFNWKWRREGEREIEGDAASVFLFFGLLNALPPFFPTKKTPTPKKKLRRRPTPPPCSPPRRSSRPRHRSCAAAADAGAPRSLPAAAEAEEEARPLRRRWGRRHRRRRRPL